jgi:predicted metal-dependent hydrolase
MQLSLPLQDPFTPDSTRWRVTFVRRRRARRYILHVDTEGNVRVTIPARGSRGEAEAFVARQGDWIVRQRTSLTPSTIPSDVRPALQARAAELLPARLRRLAVDHGVQAEKVTVRNQRTRWGSCGRNGHITLNWRLVLMPEWVADYVIVHELMHLRRLDHSAAYWKLVAAACPEYRAARQWLRQHGPALR